MPNIKPVSEVLISICTEGAKKSKSVPQLPLVSSDKLVSSPPKDVICTLAKKSYSKITGLRSMQNIKGAERDIIEMYRTQLTHDVWGDKQKLNKWVTDKIEELAAAKYPSELLSEDEVMLRENGVKAWYNALKSSNVLRNDIYDQLKIMKCITDNLKANNKVAVLPLNPIVLEDAAFLVKKSGISFKKIYCKKMREFESYINLMTENVAENGVNGKWYTIRVPDEREAKRNLTKFNHIKNYIAILSQGSNWCIRRPYTVGREFSNCRFHIFVDKSGKPQICMTSMGSSKNWFEFIKGKDQYSPIPPQFIEVLKSFLHKHNIKDAIVGRSGNTRPVTELF